MLLLNFSSPILALLIVGGAITLAVLATWYVRRRFAEEVHRANNEVAGFMFAVVGVVYGVLLAFLVLVVWQDFLNAEVTVEREANALGNLFRLSQDLPAPYDGQMQNATIEYARSVVTDEWRQMAFGESSPTTRDALDNLWSVHRTLHRANVKVGLLETELYAALQSITDERQIRLLTARSELHPLMWVLLWGGGIMTIGFTLFFRAPNSRANLLMIGMLTGVIAFVVFLIMEIDIPFAGDILVRPTPILQALDLFQHIQPR